MKYDIFAVGVAFEGQTKKVFTVRISKEIKKLIEDQAH